MVGEELPLITNVGARIGFILPAGHWLGGRNYLRNLLAAMLVLPGKPMTPVIITGKHQVNVSTEFPGIEIIATSLLDRKSPAWFARKLVTESISQDVLLRKFLQRHNISVLSHFHLGKQSAVKTVGWIPDFQHVDLPGFFTPKERMHRDREFMALCANCDKVIVSSNCARADLLSFSPENAHKAELLHFVADPKPAQIDIGLTELSSLYHFQVPFFLLPNQFWAHKNHALVIRTLQLVKEQGTPMTVLATGTPHDYRQPKFFSHLMGLAAQCGVTENFMVLGVIPYDHLVGLMRETIAFINPSHFEGWSTTVEEAKSMGKTILLSDIPVHREQAPDRGVFFNASDPASLAACMRATLQQFDPVFDKAMQEQAKAQLNERQRLFGDNYTRILASLVGQT